MIPEQAKEWADLRSDHPGVALCVAGDLNTNLGEMKLAGRANYGTTRGAGLLVDGLDNVGLESVTKTEDVPLGLLDKPHIDHVCLPSKWRTRVATT